MLAYVNIEMFATLVDDFVTKAEKGPIRFLPLDARAD
jgi:hypothetical protein